MNSLVYSTETASADLGWDQLLAEPRAAEGLMLLSEEDGKGYRVELREFFSAVSSTGSTFVVSLISLAVCDDECRYELCFHGDDDRRWDFEAEEPARAKCAYLLA